MGDSLLKPEYGMGLLERYMITQIGALASSIISVQ